MLLDLIRYKLNEQQPKPNWNEYGKIRLLSRNRLLFPEHRLTVAKFIDYFKNVDINLSVLDVGCGDGFWMEILRDLGFNDLAGIDLSFPFLQRAKSKGLKVIQCDISEMCFCRKFDIVIICDVLEHLPDIKKTLDHIHEILKENGIFYIIIPVYDSLSSKYNRFIHRTRKIDEAQKHDETHLHAFSKRDILQLLSSHSFYVEKTVYTANRLPFITGKIQKLTFGNKFGNWLSLVAKKKRI
jgi:SAM-dependent methyltransferase